MNRSMPCTMVRARRPCSFGVGAFTLFELLVVITIIAILTSMTLVAVKLVREMANSLVCANNQRQIGVCCLTYANDWEGITPQVSHPDLGNTGGWEQQCRTYLADPGSATRIYRCPAAVRTFPSLSKTVTCFSLNTRLGGSLGGGGWSNPVPYARLATMPQRVPWMADGSPYPGEKPLFRFLYSFTLDAWDPGIGQYASPWPWNDQGFFGMDMTGFGRGHGSGRRINMLFIDGHNESMELITFRGLSSAEKAALR